MIIALITSLFALGLASSANRPEIQSIHPVVGSSAGGFRVTFYGRNLALFPFQAQVFLNSGLQCTDIRVETVWAAFSCVMPACNQCGDVRLKVTVNGQTSNALRFHYDEECYDGTIPKLPRRYSNEENCTVCSSLVLLTVATVGDLATRSTLQAAMTEVCSSSLMRSWGSVDSERCRTDLSTACLALFYTSGDALIDGLYEHWAQSYTKGELSKLACQAAGRCMLP